MRPRSMVAGAMSMMAVSMLGSARAPPCSPAHLRREGRLCAIEGPAASGSRGRVACAPRRRTLTDGRQHARHRWYRRHVPGPSVIKGPGPLHYPRPCRMVAPALGGEPSAPCRPRPRSMVDIGDDPTRALAVRAVPPTPAVMAAATLLNAFVPLRACLLGRMLPVL